MYNDFTNFFVFVNDLYHNKNHSVRVYIYFKHQPFSFNNQLIDHQIDHTDLSHFKFNIYQYHLRDQDYVNNNVHFFHFVVSLSYYVNNVVQVLAKLTGSKVCF